MHSLTSCAGVADTFAVLANVDVDEKELKELIRENRGAIASYNSLDIARANKMVSSVERQIGITQQEHIAASILAIKLSAGITHLVVDIPVGPKSRIKNTNEAMRLRKLIEYVGDMLSIEIDAVITDGSEPIGNGVGAVLEARDVMKVLRNKDDAPQDLREKSLFLVCAFCGWLKVPWNELSFQGFCVPPTPMPSIWHRNCALGFIFSALNDTGSRHFL